MGIYTSFSRDNKANEPEAQSNWRDRLDLARKENSEVKWHAIIGRVDGGRLEEGLQEGLQLPL